MGDLGDKRFLMLRNHGLLTVGRSVADAFVAMYFFEAACMMQVRAQVGGRPLRRIGSAIIDGAQEQWERVTHGAGGGLVWPALLRRLDRRNPGYQRLNQFTRPRDCDVRPAMGNRSVPGRRGQPRRTTRRARPPIGNVSLRGVWPYGSPVYTGTPAISRTRAITAARSNPLSFGIGKTGSKSPSTMAACRCSTPACAS